MMQTGRAVSVSIRKKQWFQTARTFSTARSSITMDSSLKRGKNAQMPAWAFTGASGITMKLRKWVIVTPIVLLLAGGGFVGYKV